MIKIGILGAAGYTGGELIRLLLNHPEAEIVFANSESNAGNLVADVHEGLYGDTDLRFTSEMPFDQVDVVFFCFGHGKSEQFLREHTIPSNVKIIDLAQDFRLAAPDNDYVYGLPEINRERIAAAQHVANPGCFATCIQLGLLPAAKLGIVPCTCFRLWQISGTCWWRNALYMLMLLLRQEKCVVAPGFWPAPVLPVMAFTAMSPFTMPRKDGHADRADRGGI